MVCLSNMGAAIVFDSVNVYGSAAVWAPQPSRFLADRVQAQFRPQRPSCALLAALTAWLGRGHLARAGAGLCAVRPAGWPLGKSLASHFFLAASTFCGGDFSVPSLGEAQGAPACDHRSGGWRSRDTWLGTVRNLPTAAGRIERGGSCP